MRIIFGVLFIIAIIVTAICLIEGIHLLAAAATPTRLSFTIPMTDNKGTCAVPIDTVGSPGYVREVTYRTGPNGTMPMDSIAGGWYLRGATVDQFFGINTKPIPFGSWSFTTALYDSAGNACAYGNVTAPVMFDGRPPTAIFNLGVR